MLKLRELRQENRITAKTLSEKLNCSLNSIYDWELGKVEPSIEILIKISDFFDVSLDYLTGREDDFGVVKNHAAVQGGELLSAEEKDLIRNYRKLTDEQKLAVKMITSTYIKTPSESDKKQSRIE